MFLGLIDFLVVPYLKNMVLLILGRELTMSKNINFLLLFSQSSAILTLTLLLETVQVKFHHFCLVYFFAGCVYARTNQHVPEALVCTNRHATRKK